MYFYIPVKVYEEENCVRNHSGELAALGSKALIVTGRRSSRANGSLDDVIAALETEGIPYVIFDEIEENPSIETVMKARDQGLAEQADFVIGVGGGSPMDAAKAIALMIYYKEKDASYLFETGGSDESLPVAAVPTTCGTGSEATPYSILTIHEQKTKSSIPHKIFPQLSLIDGKYLESAPLHILRNTAVDALGHLYESWFNTKATDYSRIFVSEGLKIWSRSRDVLSGARAPEKEDYRNLMNASALAGMAITHTGTSLPHALSYVITYDLGMPHGKAIGHFLTGFLAEAPEEDRNYLLNLSGFSDLAEFEAFYDKVCTRETIPAQVIERTIASVMENPSKLASCPYPVDEEVLKRIAGK